MLTVIVISTTCSASYFMKMYDDDFVQSVIVNRGGRVLGEEKVRKEWREGDLYTSKTFMSLRNVF